MNKAFFAVQKPASATVAIGDTGEGWTITTAPEREGAEWFVTAAREGDERRFRIAPLAIWGICFSEA